MIGKVHLVFENNLTFTSSIDKIVETAVRESRKEQADYRLAALQTLGGILELYQHDCFKDVWQIISPALLQVVLCGAVLWSEVWEITSPIKDIFVWCLIFFLFVTFYIFLFNAEECRERKLIVGSQ